MPRRKPAERKTNKPGNHGKYVKTVTQEKLQEIKQWKSEGLSNEQIARNLKISTVTFYAWYDKHDEFRQAIDDGFAHNVYELENALYKSAIGGHVQEKKVYKTVDDSGKEVTKTEVVERYIPPNPTSIIFALKNKAPEKFFDRKHVEHSGAVVQNVNHYSNLSDDELRKLANIGSDD